MVELIKEREREYACVSASMALFKNSVPKKSAVKMSTNELGGL